MEICKIGVLGVGSSGIQCLAHLCAYLPNCFEIYSIHDPKINIVGIGESTNPSFIFTLEHGIDFNIHDQIKNSDLDSTIKLGTYYQEWRENDFINPLLGGHCAIHMNTFKLKDFAFSRLRAKWGNKFKEIHGNAKIIENTNNGVILDVDGTNFQFDYLIDCTGFPKEYDDYTVLHDHPTNHCLVHNVKTPADWGHTKHIATKDGWMFGIPLTTRTSYGYVFNDSITDTDTAKLNFSKKINVDISEMDSIEYKFVSYYCNKLIDKRIIRNGNKAVFFEPLFANSLWLYDKINRIICDYLSGVDQQTCNDAFKKNASDVLAMIKYHYLGGSTHKTKFWEYAKQYASSIFQDEIFLKTKTELQEMSKHSYYGKYEWVYGTHNLFLIDKNFKYNNFS